MENTSALARIRPLRHPWRTTVVMAFLFVFCRYLTLLVLSGPGLISVERAYGWPNSLDAAILALGASTVLLVFHYCRAPLDRLALRFSLTILAIWVVPTLLAMVQAARGPHFSFGNYMRNVGLFGFDITFHVWLAATLAILSDAWAPRMPRYFLNQR